jgi:hypothetical protein
MNKDSKEGISNIKVGGEKLLLLEDSLCLEKAREQAMRHRVKAFGMVSNFLFKPREEEISIIYEEKRYQAFWHIIGSSFFEYKRSSKYKVPVETVVDQVQVRGQDCKVNKADHTFEVEGVEHCKETFREEVLVDARTADPGDFTKYLKYGRRQIKSTDELMADGSMVVNIDTKASFLVRKILNELVKPIKADEILEEKIAIEELSLYFYPVYTFEYLWQGKDKKVVVEFDGVTGDVRKGHKLADALLHSFSFEELFDFAKEAANFIPGGGLAMMAGRKAIEIVTKK